MRFKKMHAVLWAGMLGLLLLLAYTFRPMTMNDIYDEPNFKGTVTEVAETAILVSVNEEEDEYKSSDKIWVSLQVKLKDSMTHFQVGDQVSVYYDGVILESYPAQLGEVYAIILRDAAP